MSCTKDLPCTFFISWKGLVEKPQIRPNCPEYSNNSKEDKAISVPTLSFLTLSPPQHAAVGWPTPPHLPSTSPIFKLKVLCPRTPWPPWLGQLVILDRTMTFTHPCGQCPEMWLRTTPHLFSLWKHNCEWKSVSQTWVQIPFPPLPNSIKFSSLSLSFYIYDIKVTRETFSRNYARIKWDHGPKVNLLLYNLSNLAPIISTIILL